MKILSLFLSVFSTQAFADVYKCNIISGNIFDGAGDTSVKAVVFSGPTQLVEIQQATAVIKTLTPANGGADLIQLIITKDSVQSTALFNWGNEHPFLSIAFDGRPIQIQCWLQG